MLAPAILTMPARRVSEPASVMTLSALFGPARESMLEPLLERATVLPLGPKLEPAFLSRTKLNVGIGILSQTLQPVYID